MGIELLSAGDPRRPDRRRHRRSALLGFRRPVGRIADRRVRRTRSRPTYRSSWRAGRSGALQRRPGRRPRRACGGKRRRRAFCRLGSPRHRHDARALRRRVCGVDRALWPRCARPDHRHHAYRRFCVDCELAVVDGSQRYVGLARDAADLGRTQSCRRVAAQLAAARAGAARYRSLMPPTIQSAGNRTRRCCCSRSCSRRPGSSPGRWLRIFRACSKAPALRRCRRSPPRRWSDRRKWRRGWSNSSCCGGRIRCYRREFAALLHPVGAVVFAITGPAAAAVFAVFYGAGNGLLTIARGTVPLAVFGPHGYGERTGLLGAPARAAQALAPLLFGLLLDRMGASVILVSSALCLAAFVALLFLRASREHID